MRERLQKYYQYAHWLRLLQPGCVEDERPTSTQYVVPYFVHVRHHSLVCVVNVGKV